MTEHYTVEVIKYDQKDPRLGRNVRHDSRSLAYLFQAEAGAIVSKRHYSVMGTLDQGQVGSCTGHAATKVVTYPPLWTPPVDKAITQTNLTKAHQYAVSVYSAATAIDPYEGVYPPDDTGSDGLSVAKVLKDRGLISGYQHATSLTAVLSALSKRPVIVGTKWLSNMSEPVNGKLIVSGSMEGGHEYVLDAINVEKRRVWMQNSWGSSWGRYGRAWMTFDELEMLLADYGDCTVFVPLTMPAPTPTV